MGHSKDFSGLRRSSHKQGRKMRHRSHKDVEMWVKSSQKVIFLCTADIDSKFSAMSSPLKR